MITIRPPEPKQAAVSRFILGALPDWFGIQEAIREYVEFTDDHPTFVAYDDHQAVGFLALAEHSPCAAEIFVMGVLPAYHRKGVGRALVEAAEAHLRARGFEYLQVKTVAEGNPDEGYKKTRAFYHRLGFKDLEVFPDLWDAANPCLQMIKHL